MNRRSTRDKDTIRIKNSTSSVHGDDPYVQVMNYFRKNNHGASSQQSTVGSSVSRGSGSTSSAGWFSGGGIDKVMDGRTNRTVWVGRAAFVFTLVSVAMTFGFLSYYLLAESEDSLAEAQFVSIADRATWSALENSQRKRLGILSLASAIGGANPDASQWPLVTLNNYETIASNLIATSKGCYMAFAPLVKPEELEEFENFAYDFYRSSRKPEPFPDGTAQSSFGIGVWSMNLELENSTTDMRYHDVDGKTEWGSRNQILAPMLHHVTGPSPNLMMNMHSVPLLGGMIDDMIECTNEKAEKGESLDSCALLSPPNPNTTSWVQQAEKGPGSAMMQPIYASNNPQKFVGVVVTSLVWAEIMVGTFADVVNGVNVVLTSGDKKWTYCVEEGQTMLISEGDLHDAEFDSYAVDIDLTPGDLFGPTSAKYTLTLYPTQELYDVYSTRNPMIAAVGALCMMILTASVFLLYDRFVRQEFNAKRELLEVKREFVRFVSHEVRTPLNSVCMGLALMEQEIAANADTPVDPKKAQEWLALSKDVAANSSSAVDVLNDFLNYDKVESGKLTLEYSVVPIFQLIEDTVSEFKLPAAKKNIRLVVSTPTRTNIKGSSRDSGSERFVVGDKIRLTQVFRNLISNAIKFTPEEGNVTVNASWVPLTAKEMKVAKTAEFHLLHVGNVSFMPQGRVMLTVQDSGAGMTPEQVKSVFSQGTQFNVGELQGGNGSGLGTYIAKGIVRQHGGSLGAHSDGLNKGSTFFLRLSVHDVPEDLRPNVHSAICQCSEYDSVPLSILVVDDAKINLKLLLRLLRREGHIVDGAEDGQIACTKVEEAMAAGERFDVILMDYQMPVMDGPTAAKTIRQMGCDAFIVGVTGNLMPENIKFFKDNGADAVLPKPIRIPDLEGLLFEYGVKGQKEEGVLDGLASGIHLNFDDLNEQNQFSKSIL